MDSKKSVFFFILLSFVFSLSFLYAAVPCKESSPYARVSSQICTNHTDCQIACNAACGSEFSSPTSVIQGWCATPDFGPDCYCYCADKVGCSVCGNALQEDSSLELLEASDCENTYTQLGPYSGKLIQGGSSQVCYANSESCTFCDQDGDLYVTNSFSAGEKAVCNSNLLCGPGENQPCLNSDCDDSPYDDPNWCWFGEPKTKEGYQHILEANLIDCSDPTFFDCSICNHCCNQCKKTAVLLIHGVGPDQFNLLEWDAVISKLHQYSETDFSDLSFSIFPWGTNERFETVKNKLAEEVNSLLASEDYDKIIIYAHSAGGVIATHAMPLFDLSLFKGCNRNPIEIYTVASPLRGWGESWYTTPVFQWGPGSLNWLSNTFISRLYIMNWLFARDIGCHVSYDPGMISSVEGILVTHIISGEDGLLGERNQPSYSGEGVQQGGVENAKIIPITATHKGAVLNGFNHVGLSPLCANGDSCVNGACITSGTVPILSNFFEESSAAVATVASPLEICEFPEENICAVTGSDFYIRYCDSGDGAICFQWNEELIANELGDCSSSTCDPSDCPTLSFSTYVLKKQNDSSKEGIAYQFLPSNTKFQIPVVITINNSENNTTLERYEDSVIEKLCLLKELNTTTQTINSLGGTIFLDNASITIPENALIEPTSITIRKVNLACGINKNPFLKLRRALNSISAFSKKTVSQEIVIQKISEWLR